jgi:hypothetical protein
VQTRDTGVQDEIGRLVIGRDNAQRFHRTGSYLYCALACNGKPREVADEFGRIAEIYRQGAADLEWENWPADGEGNVGKVLQEG